MTYREGKEPVAKSSVLETHKLLGVMTVDYKNDSVLYMLKVYGRVSI